MSFLKKIDLFPYSYSYKLFDSQTYKSAHGGCFSLLALLCSAIAFVLFSQDFINKKNPKSFTQVTQVFDGDKAFTLLSNENFNFHFIPVEQHSIPRKIEAISFFVNAELTKITKQRGKPAVFENYPIKVALCSELNIEVEFYPEFTYCLDLDGFEDKHKFKPEIGGMFGDLKGLWQIYLRFERCARDENTNKPIESTCIDYQTAKEATKRSFAILVDFSKTNIQLKNYENPLESYALSEWISLSHELKASVETHIDKVFFDDDRGWIFEEIETHSHLNTESFSVDYKIIDKEAYESKNNFSILNLSLTYSRNEVHHYRSYIKIQQCFANVGGVLKIITIVFGTLSKFLSERMVKVMITSKFYTFDKSENALVLREKFKNTANTSSQLSLRAGEKKRDVVSFRETSLLDIIRYLILGREKVMFSQIFNRSDRIEQSISVIKQIEKHYGEHSAR